MSTARPHGGDAHLVHDELSTPAQMSADCHVAERRLARAAAAATRPAPSLLFEDFPHEVRKPEIRVDQAAARLASALHLHLD